MSVKVASTFPDDVLFADSVWSKTGVNYESEIQLFRENMEAIKKMFRLSDKARKFLKKYGVALATILFMFIWTSVTYTIAYHNGKTETTEILTAEYENRIEAAVSAYKEQENQARFLSGEDSKRTQMASESSEIAKVLYAYRSNNENDLRAVVWCILNRVDNKYYPNSVEEVCRQASQWMGYSEENPVLQDLKQLALEELETWYSGERPVSSDYVYLYWTPTQITLRDNWKEGSTTNYWRYGK